jgi:hypothetical protein
MAGKKITELSSGSLSNLPLSGVTTVVYSGTTFQHNLTDLRNKLVDSGSHYFTGSQFINGDLTVSGSLTAQQYILSSSITNIITETISGSSNFGNSEDDIHTFTGSVNITGSLFMNGDEVNISGSGSHMAFFDGNKSLRWYDSFHAIEGGNTLALGIDQTSLGGSNSEYREKLIVASNNSHNIATFQGGAGNHYTALNIINFNSGSNASADLVIMNDIQDESSSYVNLGINSTTHTSLYCGYEGDSYLYNASRNFYIGTTTLSGNEGESGHTHIFSGGSWRNPSISLYGDTSVGFFTEKEDNELSTIPSYLEGYRTEFSGSVKMDNDLKVDGWVSGSHFIGDGSGLYNLPVQTTDVSMFLSSSTFNSFTQSIDERTDVIETSLSNLPTDLVNLGFSTTSSYFTFNETTMSMSTGENMILQTSYSGTVIGSDTETATDSQGGEDTLTFSAWIEGSGGIDYPSIVNVQPNWKASGPGLSVGATVASVNTLVFSPGQSVYQITLNTGYGLFQTGEEYTFTEPDTIGTITKNWVFESGSNLIVPNGGNIIGASNLATTGSNTFVGNQVVSGSLTTTGVLNVGIGSGDEGGEIMLARPITNTTITGSGVIIDSYRDTIRIFEQSGSTRGAFLDVTKQSNSVSSQIVTSPNLFSIETITSASYASITPVSGTLYIIID